MTRPEGPAPVRRHLWCDTCRRVTAATADRPEAPAETTWTCATCGAPPVCATCSDPWTLTGHDECHEC